MVLLLHEDLANLFRHREFSQIFALSDSIAVIANGFVFILEIEAQHLLWIFRGAYWLGRNRWHLPEIIDLPREDQGVVELLLGVDLELAGYAHILRSAEDLGIDHVTDDRLILASKVFIQQLGEAITGDFFFDYGRSELRHVVSPSN